MAYMEEILKFFDMSNKIINLFVILSCISKTTKLQRHQDVFQQCKIQQRSLESIFLTSLMGHVQSFKVLSIKYVWSFDFIFTTIQMD